MATKNVKFKSKSTGDYYYPVTAGTGVIISNNTISINLTELKNTFATKSTTLAGYGITDCYTKTQVDNLLADVSDLTFEVL